MSMLLGLVLLLLTKNQLVPHTVLSMSVFNSQILHQTPAILLTVKESETQRMLSTCPGSHSKQVAELGFKSQL